MDTPPMYRGSNYPTHLSARCPSMHQCELCKGCTNYDPHDLVCANCEARKSVDLICKHTDKQQYTVKFLTQLFRKPMAHPDDREVEVSVPVAYNDEWNKLREELDPRGLGSFSEVQDG